MNEKISACLVVYNEEKIISNCLESIKDVVDEIIVVHDGECKDNTLEICKKYGAKIFVRPHKGAMELYLPFAFKQASGSWILRIDADEFLSKELKNKFKSLILNEKADAYEFLWPLWDGNKKITKSWPYKISFFRKDKVSFLGIIHFTAKINGKIKKSNLILEHRPLYNNFSWKVFSKKWLGWARLQAMIYLKGFQSVEKFNYEGDDWPYKIKLRIKFPILLMPFEFLSTFLKDLLRGGCSNGMVGIKVALMYGVYRVMVNYYIFILKKS